MIGVSDELIYSLLITHFLNRKREMQKNVVIKENNERIDETIVRMIKSPAPAPVPAPVPAPAQYSSAVAFISGTVVNIFNGKKYNNVSVRVTDPQTGFYSDFSVKYALGKPTPQLNTFVNVNCVIKMYYRKNTNTFDTVFYAE